ncbi:hypothetical protein D1AOALGA4SA_12967 [Olavius algarvensis Delta 1 endosymbiont]|nr:hypothetical protein D1AOALGA4SA_12967 [Olavius algarvensis Delta 1 endosymbiont]
MIFFYIQYRVSRNEYPDYIQYRESSIQDHVCKRHIPLSNINTIFPLGCGTKRRR